MFNINELLAKFKVDDNEIVVNESDENAATKIDSFMSVGDYNMAKKRVHSALWKRGDGAPICNVLPGKYDKVEWFLQMQKKLKTMPDDVELVRGYKLVILISDPNCLVFGGVSHAVLRDKTTRKVECLLRDERRGNDPYIFLPSSRMHPELSDDDLLSGLYQITTVLCGDKRVVKAILEFKRTLSVFESSLFADSPETATARPTAKLMDFPFFWDYMRARNKLFQENAFDFAVSCGIPYKTNTNRDDINIANHEKEALEAVRKSTHLTREEAQEAVAPLPPWEVCPELWLAGTEKLHRAVRLLFVEDNEVKAVEVDNVICEATEGDSGDEEEPEPVQFKRAIFFALFYQLEAEYCERIQENEKKSASNFATHLSSRFA